MSSLKLRCAFMIFFVSLFFFLFSPWNLWKERKENKVKKTKRLGQTSHLKTNKFQHIWTACVVHSNLWRERKENKVKQKTKKQKYWVKRAIWRQMSPNTFERLVVHSGYRSWPFLVLLNSSRWYLSNNIDGVIIWVSVCLWNLFLSFFPFFSTTRE